jgi:hypothetical protein
VGTITANNSYLSAPNDYLSTYSIAVVDSSGSYTYLLNKDVNFIREAFPVPTSNGLPKYYALFGSQYLNPNELSFILGPTPDQNYSTELHYFYYPVSIVQGVVTTFATPIGGGANYTNGYYNNVPLYGGSGSGLIANIVVAGNVVSAVNIVNGGSFYSVGDVLTTPASNIGGSGTNFSVTISAIDNAAGTSWLGDNYDPVLLYGAMREAVVFMKGEADMVSYYEKAYQEALNQLKRLGDGLERNDAYRKGQTSLPYNQL